MRQWHIWMSIKKWLLNITTRMLTDGISARGICCYEPWYLLRRRRWHTSLLHDGKGHTRWLRQYNQECISWTTMKHDSWLIVGMLSISNGTLVRSGRIWCEHNYGTNMNHICKWKTCLTPLNESARDKLLREGFSFLKKEKKKSLLKYKVKICRPSLH